jgi:hypothetical protein
VRRGDGREDRGFTRRRGWLPDIAVERLLSNDLDGDRMVVGQVFGAVGGCVALSSNGDISFTPAANFNGEASSASREHAGGRASRGQGLYQRRAA